MPIYSKALWALRVMYWLLLLLIGIPFGIAAAEEADLKAPVDATKKTPLVENPAPKVPLLEKEPVKKEVMQVPVISKEEFKPSIRENQPRLVDRQQIESVAAENPYVLLPHRPNFILPLTYMKSPNNEVLDEQAEYYGVEKRADLEPWEILMQFSIKYQLMSGVLTKFDRIEIGYTNRSFWQAYTSSMSRPFRETNHEPELMYSWTPGIKQLDIASVSINHQSNGQSGTLSRSWNRIIFTGAAFTSYGGLGVTAWWRIPETRDADPEDPSDNDNPDIDDYLGYGELTYFRDLPNSTLHIKVRNNLDFDSNRGAIEVNYGFPFTQRLQGFIYFFDGYGESLIDYDHYQQRVGIGFKLSDWL